MNTETGMAEANTGERWEVRCRPEPFPINPFDPEEFRIDAHIVTPSGKTIIRPGFIISHIHLETVGILMSVQCSVQLISASRFRHESTATSDYSCASWKGEEQDVSLPGHCR